MKTSYEKIIKREDGSRVKIFVDLFDVRYGELAYRTSASTCGKGKRTWYGSFDSNHYMYRQLSMEDRRTYEHESQLDFVSEDELLQAKTELWEKLKPEVTA